MQVPGATWKLVLCTGNFEETYRELRGEEAILVEVYENKGKLNFRSSKFPVHVRSSRYENG